MKTNRFTLPITAAIGAAALFTAGCAKKEPMVQSPAPTASAMSAPPSPAKDMMPTNVASAPMMPSGPTSKTTLTTRAPLL
jgi:PBP1b-binding outer membrane lipoprotein LpoB